MPVPPNLPSAEVRIADRIRELRLDKGLTLKQLAQAAEISQAFLSRIENHKVSLTIAGLERLARALGVSMSAFFEEDDRTLPIAVCRAGRGEHGRLRGARGYAYETLAAAKSGKLMEPLIVDIASARQPVSLKTHSGDEFNYVLEGEYCLLYGKDEILLQEGDSVYYDASVPHAARSVPGKPCRLLVVVASRDYQFHGDLSTLLSPKGTSHKSS